MEAVIERLRTQLNHTVVGQSALVDDLLIALIAKGHVLLEGPPGIAKTTAAKSLAQAIQASFQRIQFTPDLLPGDVTGSDVYQQHSGKFEFTPGPIMHDIVLADEINRAPAKVQSALLEAMGERQVTVGQTTYPLSKQFFVIATQNPIEQEGTYPLPEAQLDRFIMKLLVDYPDAETERQVLQLVREQDKQSAPASTSSISLDDIKDLQQQALNVYMADAVEQYIIHLVMATRQPTQYFEDDGQMASLIDFGVSPRATLALDRCARAHAILGGRDYVTPDDVRAIVHNVFRHRLIPSFQAVAQNLSTEQLINMILAKVPVL
ncbi:MAG: AAA family ATPase [Marinomonas sp.]|uniref:AAA family ATPase n=1 Tax=Marinomonas communis TaxID=28254 RepID=UPI0010008EBF|nr:MoxR family ATPase [Marinomonas communis]MCC4273121.1 MoxR family ATPase [Marinomonas communis]MEC8081581.1 MoxR family ATPase [Pseudomonadota bacterium]MEC8485074.1 MoxR family ATPase [Pseudomonadota bacterium]RUM49600.1 MAG: AAA family ATPase [Marinomonas sp.]